MAELDEYKVLIAEVDHAVEILSGALAVITEGVDGIKASLAIAARLWSNPPEALGSCMEAATAFEGELDDAIRAYGELRAKSQEALEDAMGR